jgi:hypothetical protein
MFPMRVSTALAPIVLVIAVSAACGGDDSELTPASTREERAALCAKLDTKKCNLGSAGAAGCEIRLEGASQPVVDALDACITQSKTPCDEAWQSCVKGAFEQRAPGHPNVPTVTSCKAKNNECASKYRPSSTDRDNAVLRKAIDAACDAIVALDGVTEGHARECQTKDCDAFSTCILDASIDVDATP